MIDNHGLVRHNGAMEIEAKEVILIESLMTLLEINHLLPVDGDFFVDAAEFQTKTGFRAVTTHPQPVCVRAASD